MTTPPGPVLGFEDQLSYVDDRSAALRAAAAAAGTGARVPSCPDWSVADLVAHLGAVHLFWTAVVSAGPGRRTAGRERARRPDSAR